MNRGDIYFVTLDPAIGHEQRGHRPVLILTTAEYNKVTQVPLVAAITNGGRFALRNQLGIALDASTKTTGIIRADQIRHLDLRERSARFVESVPASVVETVLNKVAALLY